VQNNNGAAPLFGNLPNNGAGSIIRKTKKKRYLPISAAALFYGKMGYLFCSAKNATVAIKK
jgi:hypothetical protein